MPSKWDYSYKSCEEMKKKLARIAYDNHTLSLKKAMDFCINTCYEAIEKRDADVSNQGTRSDSH